MKTKPISEEEHYVFNHLSPEQWAVFVAWCEENEINELTIECEKGLKNGIRIFGESEVNGESWEIDFIYEKENQKMTKFGMRKRIKNE